MVSNPVGGDAAMIELEQLVAGYDGVAITPPLSGMICPGSLTAIVGLNGCGKSTLLKTLAGFLPPVSGRLRWQGTRPVIGWLAQRHALESQFPLNVQDVVSQGAWPGVSLLRGLGGGTRRRIGAVLERVGLAGLGENADRSALRRPVSAHAICPGDGAAGAAGDARRALHRYRRSDQSRTNGFDPRDAPAGTDHPRRCCMITSGWPTFSPRRCC